MPFTPRRRKTLLTSDFKKLMRAALEPARVFGRRDFDDGKAPELLAFTVGEAKWYGPGWPTWLFAGGECKVLAKALERYGSREPLPQQTERFADYMHSMLVDDGRGFEVDIPNPEFLALSDGRTFAGYELADGSALPATPVLYLLRRFGVEPTWSTHPTMSVVRGYVDGDVVAAVRTIANEKVSHALAA